MLGRTNEWNMVLLLLFISARFLVVKVYQKYNGRWRDYFYMRRDAMRRVPLTDLTCFWWWSRRKWRRRPIYRLVRQSVSNLVCVEPRGEKIPQFFSNNKNNRNISKRPCWGNFHAKRGEHRAAHLLMDRHAGQRRKLLLNNKNRAKSSKRW